jgi:hypothetical protein
MTSLLALALLASCGPLGLLALDDWDKFALVWEDNFDFLDLNKWQHEVTAAGGGNGEFQLYTQEPTNSFVQGGLLHIRPTLLANTRNPATNQPYGQDFMQYGILNVWDLYGTCTNDDNGGCYRTGAAGNIPAAMSARLRTYQRYSYTYGRVVIRAKMPVGDWLWPAIWMLPEDWVYGGWPRSGEIDIIESIGNRDFHCGGNRRGMDYAGCALHWGTNWDQNRYWLTNLGRTDSRNFGDNFHIYVFEWSPNGLRFFYDDEVWALMDVPYPLVDQNPWWINFWEWGKPWPINDNIWASGNHLAPFDRAFHFILNVAVGGTGGFIPDGCTNRGGAAGQQKPWNNGDGYVNGMRNFYNGRGAWLPTWDSEGANNHMQVDYIRVYQGD